MHNESLREWLSIDVRRQCEELPMPRAMIKDGEVLRAVQDLPMRTAPDWMAVIEYVKCHGSMLLEPDIPVASGRVSLFRHGYQIKALRQGGQVVAYKVAPRETKD